ncbi:hypothetical protein GCM10010353_20300 [Streptomyces chryseus]|uniref:Uncharacterized protein n=1 Tax=Streptomyces chryseus TaxID=68186 RepID=A0ABQ3DQ03_9ACTN|nr:hypothetical protein GCM10010353_20300 [Streptomyces chryseus]GHB08007.1 hypothetical protein GCM10010346_34190 [Streptomyces chryseus]
MVRTRVRGLRCDAKAGISFRGPPTGLAVGFGREKRKVPYGPWDCGPIHPRWCAWVPGSELPCGRPDSAWTARSGAVRRLGYEQPESAR